MLSLWDVLMVTMALTWLILALGLTVATTWTSIAKIKTRRRDEKWQGLN
jgi:hypothetical protein